MSTSVLLWVILFAFILVNLRECVSICWRGGAEDVFIIILLIAKTNDTYHFRGMYISTNSPASFCIFILKIKVKAMKIK